MTVNTENPNYDVIQAAAKYLQACNYKPTAHAIVFVSKYMIKKYGIAEALSRSLKRKSPKVIKA